MSTLTALGTVVVVAAEIGVGCSTTPETPADRAEAERQQIYHGELDILSGVETMKYMVEAVGFSPRIEIAVPVNEDGPPPGRLNRIFYLLSASIRDRLSYAEFVRRWPDLRPRFEALFRFRPGTAIGLDELESIAGRPAVEITFDGAKTGIIAIEEFDPHRFPGERLAVWRLAGEPIEALFDDLLAPSPTDNR